MARWARLGGGAALLGIGWWAAAGAACSADVESTAAEGGAGGGGGAFGDSTCGSCVTDACASLAETCRADPECAGYIDCVFACPPSAEGPPDAACRAACPAPSSDAGESARADYDLCLDGLAGCAACGHQPAAQHPFPNQGCAPSTNPQACLQCWLSNCCDTAEQCFTTNTECGELFDCIVACDGAPGSYSDCNGACFEEHPGGVADYLMDYSCTDIMCTSPGNCDPQAPSSCELCARASCSGPQHACNVDPDCYLINLCNSECFDQPGCGDSCLVDRPVGARQLFEATRICVLEQCASECNNSL